MIVFLWLFTLCSSACGSVAHDVLNSLPRKCVLLFCSYYSLCVDQVVYSHITAVLELRRGMQNGMCSYTQRRLSFFNSPLVNNENMLLMEMFKPLSCRCACRNILSMLSKQCPTLPRTRQLRLGNADTMRSAVFLSILMHWGWKNCREMCDLMVFTHKYRRVDGATHYTLSPAYAHTDWLIAFSPRPRLVQVNGSKCKGAVQVLCTHSVLCTYCMLCTHCALCTYWSDKKIYIYYHPAPAPMPRFS